MQLSCITKHAPCCPARSPSHPFSTAVSVLLICLIICFLPSFPKKSPNTLLLHTRAWNNKSSLQASVSDRTRMGFSWVSSPTGCFLLPACTPHQATAAASGAGTDLGWLQRPGPHVPTSSCLAQLSCDLPRMRRVQSVCDSHVPLSHLIFQHCHLHLPSSRGIPLSWRTDKVASCDPFQFSGNQLRNFAQRNHCHFQRPSLTYAVVHSHICNLPPLVFTCQILHSRTADTLTACAPSLIHVGPSPGFIPTDAFVLPSSIFLFLSSQCCHRNRGKEVLRKGKWGARSVLTRAVCQLVRGRVREPGARLSWLAC